MNAKTDSKLLYALFVKRCGNACRQEGQLFLAQRPQVLEALLAHMLAHPAATLLMPLLARALDHDCTLQRHAPDPAAAARDERLATWTLVESQLLVPLAVKVQHQLHLQVCDPYYPDQ